MSAIWRQAASNRYIDLALSDDPMNAHGDPGVDAYIRKIREAKRWLSSSSGVQPFPLSKSPLRGVVSRNGGIKSISTALLRESVRIVVWRTLWRLLWVMEGGLVLMGGGGVRTSSRYQNIQPRGGIRFIRWDIAVSHGSTYGSCGVLAYCSSIFQFCSLTSEWPILNVPHANQFRSSYCLSLRQILLQWRRAATVFITGALNPHSDLNPIFISSRLV